MIQLALFQPSIPPNTGNIARQCAGMGVPLHLIGPLSIDLSAKAVRRAGLDYWPYVDLTVHTDPEAFLVWLDGRRCWMVSKHGPVRYDHASYSADDVLILGNELNGLPDSWLERDRERSVYLPIRPNVRSYNLADCAAVVLTEAFRQTGLWNGFDRD
jgi:tRNA (cytidine/uridine-2'-O-)-methyltransferase